MPAMWSEMKRMCQDGKLGDGEMMLLFAFRDEVGDVNSGVYVWYFWRLWWYWFQLCRISAHSTHNKRDMKDFTDDFKTRIEVPWVTYADHVLPSKFLFTLVWLMRLIALTANVSEELDSKYPIPCDSTGLPLFPGLNIHKLPPDDLKSYCVRYFSMLWGMLTSTDSCQAIVFNFGSRTHLATRESNAQDSVGWYIRWSIALLRQCNLFASRQAEHAAIHVHSWSLLAC